jgi:hypothetical protein
MRCTNMTRHAESSHGCCGSGMRRALRCRHCARTCARVRPPRLEHTHMPTSCDTVVLLVCTL